MYKGLGCLDLDQEGWFFVDGGSCVFAVAMSMELWFLRQVAIHASMKCRKK